MFKEIRRQGSKFAMRIIGRRPFRRAFASGFERRNASCAFISAGKPRNPNPKMEIDRKYLTRPEIKIKRAEEARHYREHKHAEILAQPWFARRLEQRDAHYHRPFIAIDFEGMKYIDRNVTHNGVVWPDHNLFLGGAGGVVRTAPELREPCPGSLRGRLGCRFVRGRPSPRKREAVPEAPY
jgi:hypothetical protein